MKTKPLKNCKKMFKKLIKSLSCGNGTAHSNVRLPKRCQKENVKKVQFGEAWDYVMLLLS